MKRFVTLTSNVFGVMMLAFAVLVTVDTIARKLLNFSFQGTDELGGYALAVGSSLAFTVALIERAHIRIDLLHTKLPVRVQAVLNWLSSIMLAGFGAMLVWVCYTVIVDTIDYHSTAATPWATPLIYPQAAWYTARIRRRQPDNGFTRDPIAVRRPDRRTQSRLPSQGRHRGAEGGARGPGGPLNAARTEQIGKKSNKSTY
jgi:TRAP-type C4-dicarboxylate transport system permease small subunit